MHGEPQHVELDAYSESHYPLRFGWSPLRALRAGRYKLIEAPPARAVRPRSGSVRGTEYLRGAARSRASVRATPCHVQTHSPRHRAATKPANPYRHPNYRRASLHWATSDLVRVASRRIITSFRMEKICVGMVRSRATCRPCERPRGRARGQYRLDNCFSTDSEVRRGGGSYGFVQAWSPASAGKRTDAPDGGGSPRRRLDCHRRRHRQRVRRSISHATRATAGASSLLGVYVADLRASLLEKRRATQPRHITRIARSKDVTASAGWDPPPDTSFSIRFKSRASRRRSAMARAWSQRRIWGRSPRFGYWSCRLAPSN